MRRRTRHCACPLLLLAAISWASPLWASTWSDTYIGYRYGQGYREPYNPNDITKNIISLTHASGYKYGGNFFNVDMLMSNSEDAASCDVTENPDCNPGGAHEAFVVYRTTFSGSAITGIPLKWGGVIRDVGLTAGFDFNAKDDQFSARVWRVLVGPKLSFDVPGYFDVAIEYRTEHNHDWYATVPEYNDCNSSTGTCGDVQFQDTAQLEVDWGIPFKLGLPFKFQGFGIYVGAKGADGEGADTKPEILLEPAVLADLGSLIHQKDTFWLGFGYQYWHNKFGDDTDQDPTGGSTAHVPQFEVEWHF